MKRFLPVVAALLLAVLSSQDVMAREELPELDTSNYFIQDHADILSPETVEELNALGEHLEEGTGAELLLMTMPTIGQEHRQDYALRVLREYGVGKAEHDNGIVIFLNLDNGNEFNNRGIDIQVGYGVEGYLNDAKIGRIIDNTAMESFQNAAAASDEGTANVYYEEGLVNLYNAIYQESLDAYGFVDGEFTRETPEDDAGAPSLSGSIIRMLIAMGAIYLLYKIFSDRGGPRGPRGPGGRSRRARRRGGPIVLFPPSGGGFGSGGGSGGGGGFGGFGGGSGGGGGAGRGF